MKETILIKVGEIALKGLNRRSFEDVLIKNIKRRVNCITPCEIKIAQSTIAVTPYKDDVDFDEIEEHIDEIEQEKEEKHSILYDNVAIPEVHIHKKKK